MSYPWKPGMRCKLVRPADPRNYGLTGTMAEVFEQGELVKTHDELGREWLDWVDCLVRWDDGEETYQRVEQLSPLTPPKPDLAKWEDMPCNPDGTYKEEVFAYV